MTLRLLACPSCNSNLTGEKQTAFLYCPGCGDGFELRSDDALNRIPVYFARLQQTSGQFRPFWAFDARLDLRNREAKKGLRQMFSQAKGLIRLFEERQTIRFYVPAYTEDAEASKSFALQLTSEQPDLQYVSKQSELKGILFSQEDARKLADFLFLTSEIDQPDMVRSLDYSLILENPILVAIAL